MSVGGNNKMSALDELMLTVDDDEMSVMIKRNEVHGGIQKEKYVTKFLKDELQSKFMVKNQAGKMVDSRTKQSKEYKLWKSIQRKT
eukprot:UN08964